MIQWDEGRQILTDYMGYPISRTEALELRDQVRKHLKNSAADLAEQANKIAEASGTDPIVYRAEGFA